MFVIDLGAPPGVGLRHHPFEPRLGLFDAGVHDHAGSAADAAELLTPRRSDRFGMDSLDVLWSMLLPSIFQFSFLERRIKKKLRYETCIYSTEVAQGFNYVEIIRNIYSFIFKRIIFKL